MDLEGEKRSNSEGRGWKGLTWGIYGRGSQSDNPRAAAEKVVIMMTLEGRRDGAGLKDSRSFGPMPEGF